MPARPPRNNPRATQPFSCAVVHKPPVLRRRGVPGRHAGVPREHLHAHPPTHGIILENEPPVVAGRRIRPGEDLEFAWLVRARAYSLHCYRLDSCRPAPNSGPGAVRHSEGAERPKNPACALRGLCACKDLRKLDAGFFGPQGGLRMTRRRLRASGAAMSGCGPGPRWGALCGLTAVGTNRAARTSWVHMAGMMAGKPVACLQQGRTVR